jgi:hypothetical protein
MKFDQYKRDWVSNEVDDGMGKSYFPLRLRYEGDTRDTIVSDPDEIDNRAFIVLETRLKIKKVKVVE